MTESRATDPVFPPGRYGHRRDGRRHLTAPIVAGVLGLTLCVLLAVKLYRQYGDPAYDPQIVGWPEVTDTSMTIRFTVGVPAGAAARCDLRARTYGGVEVGRTTVTVRADRGATLIDTRERVATSGRAAVGEVLGCRPAG